MQPLSLRAQRVIAAASGFDDARDIDRDRVRAKIGVALAAGASVTTATELSRAAEFSSSGQISQSAQAPLTAHTSSAGLFGAGGKALAISKALGALVAVGAAAAAAIAVWTDEPASPVVAVAQPQVPAAPVLVEPVVLSPTTTEDESVPDETELATAPEDVSEFATAPADVPEAPARESDAIAFAEPKPARSRALRGPAKARLRATLSVPAPKPATVSDVSAPAVSAPASLAAELAAISQIRQELAAGKPERALHLLATYENDFPKPVFGVEAKALQVDALCAAEQPEQSHQAARVFLSRWPTSPLAERVRKACP